MSKFAKKAATNVTEKKEAVWTNDPALQDQETGKTTGKGSKFKKDLDKKVADKTPAKKVADKAPAKKASSTDVTTDTRKITLLTKENPKRGTAFERFALYKNNMTVDQYIAAGGKKADIAWDVKQGFIKVA